MLESRTQVISSITGKDYTETSSNAVSSCLIRESCVLKAPIGSVWEGFKSFQLDKISPSLISSCKFLSGNPCQIGSTYQVEYKDSTSVVYCIVELSDLKRSLTIDMLESTPKMPFSSMLTTITFCKVTEDDSTYVGWEALFSNDVSTDMLKSKKERCLQLFKDMRSYFEKKSK
jgi:hypothetical protein